MAATADITRAAPIQRNWCPTGSTENITRLVREAMAGFTQWSALADAINSAACNDVERREVDALVESACGESGELPDAEVRTGVDRMVDRAYAAR
jgi:hypothetical protein